MILRIFLFFIMPLVVFAQSNDVCLQCHSDPDLKETISPGKSRSVYVNISILNQSIHSGFDCTDCHQQLQGYQNFPHPKKLKPVNCGACHSDIAAKYDSTMHGLKFIHLSEMAPRCWDCHGRHDILPPGNAESKVNFSNLHNSCYTCHSNKNLLNADTLLFPTVTLRYLEGVHGKLLMSGDSRAPSCNSCHPAHKILLRIDPKSTIYKLNIPNTCGHCHIEELAQFGASTHYNALIHGIVAAPACNDCHGEHKVLNPDSAFIVAANESCIGCHNNPKIIQEYGLPSEVVSTYEDSYHGRSIVLGRRNAATCASCHGHHNILPASDPFSSVNKNNLVRTCSKCHTNVTPAFAESYTHVAMLIRSNPINDYITLFYIILIASVIGGMFLHNFFLYLRYVRNEEEENRVFYIIRLRPSEVFQHAILTITFTVLAVSGFGLRFPHSWWVSIFESMGIHEAQRGMIHRVAAVCFIMISLYHLYYIIFTERGKYLFRQIFPRSSDIQEAIQSFKYFLGLRKSNPEFEEFDYTEKAEYWALVWGGIIMAATGIILWFPTLITSFAPSWIVMASQLVHFYEAILATAAIIIFHIFIVMYHPGIYPMNLSWINGKMSLRAAIHEHPIWIKRILKDKKQSDILPKVIQENCESIEDIKNYLNFENMGKEIAKKNH